MGLLHVRIRIRIRLRGVPPIGYPEKKNTVTGIFLFRFPEKDLSRHPSLNGHLHYPNDIDRSLNESPADKIRKYRGDYNNNPPNAISFMTVIASTSGRLHSEFVRLLFIQSHRETDRFFAFFAASGVQIAQTDRDEFPDFVDFVVVNTNFF